MRQGVLLANHKSLAEREQAAAKCAAELKLKMPILMDNMDNKVSLGYGAWPDRLYVVDREGKVAYQGGPGPAGFKPEEAKAALEKLINR